MDHFQYRSNEAYCEELPLAQLAKQFGTPLYVYSQATLSRHLMRLKDAFSGYPTTPCFAVKANSNIHILKRIFAAGFGADLVSLGELERSLLAGASPDRIVFSGVGKQENEIVRALHLGIRSFNVESRFELDLLASLAAREGKDANVSLRINPNIDARTNPKIATGLHSTKFGLLEGDALKIASEIKSSPSLRLVGIACHIGSQMVSLEPLADAAGRMARLASSLKDAGHPLTSLNMGGGLGIRYSAETPPELEDYANVLIDAVKPTGLELVIEPGRVLVGNVGILMTSVLGVKETPEKTFVIVDAAMNDLMRPSMYDSYHAIHPVRQTEATTITADIVGPICETGDFLGKHRALPRPEAGDHIFLRGCGAYGSSMASQYNSRPRAPEVLVDGSTAILIRKRETLEQLWQNELGLKS